MAKRYKQGMKAEQENRRMFNPTINYFRHFELLHLD